MNQNSYFKVQYTARVNLLPTAPEFEFPAHELLLQEMPEAFRLASLANSAEHSHLMALRSLGDVSEQLIDYLQYQAKKLDMVYSFILAGQDDSDCQFETLALGADGFTIPFDERFQPESILQCKLFIPEHGVAIYGYTKVSEITADQIQCDFVCMRDEDREQLIRATLHIQGKQLKQRAQETN